MTTSATPPDATGESHPDATASSSSDAPAGQGERATAGQGERAGHVVIEGGERATASQGVEGASGGMAGGGAEDDRRAEDDAGPEGIEAADEVIDAEDAGLTSPTSYPLAGTGGPPPGIDPSPLSIHWWNLPRWALMTYRAERRYYRRLDRPRKLTSRRLAASFMPHLESPIFLIGAARSGTTFLGDCVGRVPEISYHHEPPATKAAGRYVYEGDWGFRRTRWFYRLVYAWLLRVELDGGRRLCDKTPTNALLVPFLDRAFRNARFIHIIRDGRDAAASHMRKPWLRQDAAASGQREPGGYLHGPWAPWWVEPDRVAEFETTSDAHRMIWAWRRYTEAALRDGRALGPGRYLELRYETLVTKPQEEGEKILAFLGVTGDRSRRLFQEALARAEEGSLGTWRHSFNPAEVAQIRAEAGDLLEQLDYADW